MSPRDLDTGRLRQLLKGVDPQAPLPERIDRLSRTLIGRPYQAHPLIGGATEPEVFTASLRSFDCVTFVETVLALARARTPARFAGELRRLRYAGGRVSYWHRNHYMTRWIRNNSRRGVVREILPAPPVERLRVLRVLPAFKPRPVRVRCVPKRAFWKARRRVETGDILFFASTRSDRDVFHLGFAVWREDVLRLRNAARSRGSVVEQDLAEFLEENRMAGLILARPREAFSR